MLQFLSILSLTVFGTMDLDELKIQHKILEKILLVFGGFSFGKCSKYLHKFPQCVSVSELPNCPSETGVET